MESNTKDRRYVNLGNGVQRTQNLDMPRRFFGKLIDGQEVVHKPDGAPLFESQEYPV